MNRVELLPTVYAVAKKYVDKYEAIISKGDYKHTGYTLTPNVVALQSDFFLIDFSDADIIYLPSTTFEAKLMNDISRKCQSLKPGTRIISLGKPMPCITEPDCNVVFKVYEKRDCPMTWGFEPTFFQTKE